MLISNPTARLGEEIASKYLLKKGYRIIERNFRKGYGEIDIVCVYDNVLIFVEVKTRKTNLFGGAKESIGYHKIKSLIKTAQFYKAYKNGLPESLRIDGVFITLTAENAVSEIEHIENISA